MRTVLDSLKGQLIVSCQTLGNKSLHSPFIMSRMALAAAQDSAIGIRANSMMDIRAIKGSVSLPVIGAIKRDYLGSDVFITTTLQEIDGLMTIEPEIIALSATTRPYPGGQALEELITQVHARCPSVLLTVDIITIDKAVTAERLGFDCVDTTLYDYTVDIAGHVLAENDCGFLHDVLVAVSVPIMAEGNVDTPERAARCLTLGAHTVVVDGAITRSQQMTTRFVVAVIS